MSEKLRQAVRKFLDGRMKHFNDSRAVDDDLVELAAALQRDEDQIKDPAPYPLNTPGARPC